MGRIKKILSVSTSGGLVGKPGIMEETIKEWITSL